MGTERTEGTEGPEDAGDAEDVERTGDAAEGGTPGEVPGARPGLEVTARILPENLRVYELLVNASKGQGMTPDEVNTTLINVGLVTWVKRISEDVEALERSSEGKGGP
jgi:hypothetical protein